MNILIVGSAPSGLRKVIDWLNATSYIINKLVIVDERRSKMQYLYKKFEEQPHKVEINNLSAIPDGEEGKPSEYDLGRAMDINDIIRKSFPDGSVDFLFFGIRNDKADILLDRIDPSVHRIGTYYFLEEKGYK